jgi:hypothetical protein
MCGNNKRISIWFYVEYYPLFNTERDDEAASTTNPSILSFCVSHWISLSQKWERKRAKVDSVCCMLHTCFLLGLFFDTEDGGEILLRNFVSRETTRFLLLHLMTKDPISESLFLKRTQKMDRLILIKLILWRRFSETIWDKWAISHAGRGFDSRWC